MATDPDPDVPAALHGRRISSSNSPACTYVLDGLLGAGTQALVFAARAESPSSLLPIAPSALAIKVFRPSFLRAFGAQAELIAQKELFALSRLPPSPHVVRLLDHGSLAHEGTTLPWLALERVEGRSLKAVIESEVARGPFALDPRRALRVLGHAAEGLRLLHEGGVLHRDVKPSNVLVSGAPPSEHARIADLGVCRPDGFGPTFGIGAELGSPAYSAPEMGEPSRAGPLADVFSFGALTYFALSGEPMFAGSSMVIAALKAKEIHVPLARRPSVHPAFAAAGALPAIEEALTRATGRDPEARPPGMRALWTELGGAIARAVQQTQSVAGPAPVNRTTMGFRVERRRAMTAKTSSFRMGDEAPAEAPADARPGLLLAFSPGDPPPWRAFPIDAR